jgi:hypothetical protein
MGIKHLLSRKQTNALFFVLGNLGAILVGVAGARELRQQSDSVWGPESNGVRIGLQLTERRRAEFHPGEYLEWVISLDQPADRRVSRSGRYLEFHIVTPAGKECVFIEMGSNAKRWEKLGHNPGRWKPLPDGARWLAPLPRQAKWRLSEQSLQRRWTDVKTGQESPVSLQPSGTYRMWATFGVVTQKDAPADAWQGGAATSNMVEWKITELPVEQRKLRLTDGQNKLLTLWLADGPESYGAFQTLDEMVVLTENEGLARRLALLSASDSKQRSNAIYMVTHRAGSLSEIGIDGPYLRDIAEAALVSLEQGQFARGNAAEYGPMHIASLLPVYLHFHPEESQIRSRAVAVAEKYCRVPILRSPLDYRGTTTMLPHTLAWEILLQANRLHTGMAVEEATQLLGPPTSKHDETLSWYLDWGMRGAPPTLTATVHDGKILRWGAPRN